MGVDRTSYLIYGFKFDKKDDIKVIDDNYEELLDGEYCEIFNNRYSEQTIVYDYMCKEYVYAGITVAKLDEYDDDESIEIDDTEFYKLNNKLTDCINGWPDYLIKLIENKKPKLYFFIHAY